MGREKRRQLRNAVHLMISSMPILSAAVRHFVLPKDCNFLRLYTDFTLLCKDRVSPDLSGFSLCTCP